MSCAEFRRDFRPESREARLLDHVRSCDACLDYAAHLDPEVMFSALGGEMIPPGGVDAFVDDVMREVRLRSAEGALAPGRGRTISRLAAAAALAATIAGTTFIYERNRSATIVATPRIARTHSLAASVQATKPAVETYDSAGATIVEMPADGSDTQVVMIFDENLPADL